MSQPLMTDFTENPMPVPTNPGPRVQPAAQAATPDRCLMALLGLTAAASVGAQETPVAVQVENPYGLEALWASGDGVVHFTLAILVLMSVATWYVLVTKALEQLRLAASGRAANAAFWNAATVAEGVQALEAGGAFRHIAERGLAASQHHAQGMGQNIDLHTWLSLSIERAIGDVGNRLAGGLAVLATVGSTAPFIGLFGTVWGIYHALTAIGIAGQASIDKVAGPVGEALIMTAIGLAVAVPAVLGYNFLVRRNKVVMESVRRFGGDLHAVLLGGQRPGASQGSGS